MRIDLNEALADGQWFDHPDGGKFKIRPYPAHKEKMVVRYSTEDSVPELSFSGDETLKKFKHCLVAWEDVNDAEGKPVELTEVVKEKIFNYRLNGIVRFVFEKVGEMQTETEDSEKNS